MQISLNENMVKRNRYAANEALDNTVCNPVLNVTKGALPSAPCVSNRSMLTGCLRVVRA